MSSKISISGDSGSIWQCPWFPARRIWSTGEAIASWAVTVQGRNAIGRGPTMTATHVSDSFSKYSFIEIYNRDLPTEYYATLSKLKYREPDFASRTIRNYISNWRYLNPDRTITILDIACGYAAELGLPVVQRCFRHPVLPAQIGRLRTGLVRTHSGSTAVSAVFSALGPICGPVYQPHPSGDRTGRY
jgi:hypothetical protein